MGARGCGVEVEVEVSKLWRLGVGRGGCSSVVVMVLGVSAFASKLVGLVVISVVFSVCVASVIRFFVNS